MDEVTKAINHFSTFMEDQNAKLEVVLEAVGDIQRKVAHLPRRAEFDELKQDVKTIKAAVIGTNRDLAEHKRMSADAAHGSGHVRRSRWRPA